MLLFARFRDHLPWNWRADRSLYICADFSFHKVTIGSPRYNFTKRNPVHFLRNSQLKLRRKKDGRKPETNWRSVKKSLTAAHFQIWIELAACAETEATIFLIQPRHNPLCSDTAMCLPVAWRQKSTPQLIFVLFHPPGWNKTQKYLR